VNRYLGASKLLHMNLTSILFQNAELWAITTHFNVLHGFRFDTATVHTGSNSWLPDYDARSLSLSHRERSSNARLRVVRGDWWGGLSDETGKPEVPCHSRYRMFCVWLFKTRQTTYQ
jgi:hypothetical protein